MTRYIVLAFNSDMHSVFVYKHDGNAECMLPIDTRNDIETAVSSIPLLEIEDSPMSDEDLIATVCRLRISKVDEEVRHD